MFLIKESWSKDAPVSAWTQLEVVGKIKNRGYLYDNRREFAQAIGITPATLTAVLGRRSLPSSKVLEYLGLKELRVWVKTDRNKAV